MKKLEHDLKQGKDSLFTIFDDLEYDEIEELILLNGSIEEEDEGCEDLWGELDKRMDTGELKFPTLKKLHLINWFDWDEDFANTFHNMNIWFPNLETLIIEKFENPLDLTDLHSFRNIKIIKFIDSEIKLYFDEHDDYYQPIPHELAEIYSGGWKPSFQKLEKIDYFSITDENSLKMLKNIKFIGHLGISKCHDIDNLIKYLEKIKINKLILGMIERSPDWVTINTKDINKLLSLGIKKVVVFGTIKLEDGSNFVGEKEFTK